MRSQGRPPRSPAPAGPDARRPRRRDRRGRGVRGQLTPVGVPVHRTRGEAFDDLVMDAVDEIEEHWGSTPAGAEQLAALEFAVEDVPPSPSGLEFTADVVLDRGVPLGRLFREGVADIDQPVIVVYRRPIEARAQDDDDRADLVFMVVIDLAAEYLGRDPGDLD